MLILTRRIGEVVMVGDEIKVVVVGAVGAQVRLGIDAPRDVAVHREEVYEKVKREEQERRPADEARWEQALLEKVRALEPGLRMQVSRYIDELLKNAD